MTHFRRKLECLLVKFIFFYKIEDNKFIDKCIGLQTARKVKSCDKRKERRKMNIRVKAKEKPQMYGS